MRQIILISRLLLVAATLAGCQSARINPAYSPSAFGDSDTASLKLETDSLGSATFSALDIEKCPKATLEEIGHLPNGTAAANATIPAGRKFALIVSDGSCGDSGTFLPLKDAAYLAHFAHATGNGCRITVMRAATAGAPPSEEASFTNVTRMNVYGLTASAMCPRVPQ